VTHTGASDEPVIGRGVPGWELPLPPEERAKRAGSFGGVAAEYDRFRPGPPAHAVDWILGGRRGRAVDLGAGTGALSRVLLERVDEVIAVEPDERMCSVLAAGLPQVRAVDGRGEAIPLPDGSIDAVVASSSWHWMDPVPTLEEVARVLVPGGVLGALWSGPDPHSEFAAQARAILASGVLDEDHADEASRDANRGRSAGGDELAGAVMGDGQRPPFSLDIPPGLPYEPPEHEVHTWDVALNTEELIGFLGTMSWIIVMPADRRAQVLEVARRALRDVVGLHGDATIDVGFRSDAWRARRR